jgi:hypothetical protein
MAFYPVCVCGHGRNQCRHLWLYFLEIARWSHSAHKLPRLMCNHTGIDECFSGFQTAETRRRTVYSADVTNFDCRGGHSTPLCPYINLDAVDLHIISPATPLLLKAGWNRQGTIAPARTSKSSTNRPHRFRVDAYSQLLETP